MSEGSTPQAKVYDVLNGFSTAMFVTFDRDGKPRARPMHLALVEQDAGDIWFLTGKGGALLEEVKGQPSVLLAFQKDNAAYLSLRGKARIVDDKKRIKELWKEPYKVWFPGGPEDPEIALVRVEAVDAEYWDNRGVNKLEYIFEAAKAYVKGTKPDVGDPDQHARTKL